MTEENKNQILTLSELSKQTGYHPDYLGFLCRTGKLKAFRVGRNWMTTQNDADDFIKNYKNGIKEVIDEAGQKIPVHVQTEPFELPENRTTSDNLANDNLLTDHAKANGNLPLGHARQVPAGNIASSHDEASEPKLPEQFTGLGLLRGEVLNSIESRIETLSQNLEKAEDKALKSSELSKNIAPVLLPFAAEPAISQNSMMPEELTERSKLTAKFISNFNLENQGSFIPEANQALGNSNLFGPEKVKQLYQSFSKKQQAMVPLVASAVLIVLAGLFSLFAWQGFIGSKDLVGNQQETKIFYSLNNPKDNSQTATQTPVVINQKIGTEVINKLLGLSQSQVYSAIDDRLNQYLAEGKFAGPQGPAGPAGTPGVAGVGTSYAPITYVQPNPGSGFSGSSILSATDFSANNATINNLITNGQLTANGPAVFNSSANFNASTTATNLTVGNLNLGFSPGSVIFDGQNGLAQDNSNLFYTASTSQLSLGTTSPSPSALLELDSTSKGFLAPHMTQAQRDAIASPANGLLIYNTDTNSFNVYSGGFWTPIGAGGGGGAVATGTPGSFAYYSSIASQVNPQSVLFFSANHIGVGSSVPGSLLAVQGSSTSPNLNLFSVASSSGASLFNIAPSGSTTISSLGTGIVRSASGVLFNGSINLGFSDVSGILGVNNGGTGTSTLGSLTAGSGLSITGGQNVLVGTSTQISLGNNVITTVSTGTSGSIFNISTSTNSLTLNLPIASSVNTGQLQSADWTAFNSKVTSVSGAGSITSSGGTTPTIQLQNLAANDILFGQGNNTIATSSNFTFNGNTLAVTGSTTISNILTVGGALAVTGTSTLATTTISSLTVNGNSISGTNSGDITLTGQNYLTLSGQQITANVINLSGSNVTSVLPVANGGTGQSILTANDILFGNGTNGVASSSSIYVVSNILNASTALFTTLNVTGTPTFSGVSNCNGQQFLQISSGAFGCGSPAAGGATTTINGALGPTFTFQSANPSLNIATSSNIVTFTVSTSTVQGLITGTSPINVTNGVVSLQGNLGSNNYYTSGYLNSSSTQVTNATTTGQFFLSALPNTILTTNGAGMVVATTTTFQPSGNYLTSVSVNSPLTGNGTSGSALGLSGNFGSLNVTTSGYLNASTTLATSATTTNLGILGVTGCNILNTTALGTVGCNTSSYLTANQTITLSGAFTGSGATSIFTSFASTTPIAFGGTGITTAPTANGQLLMASSTGWTIGSLIAGTNVTITTTTPGQITIAAISSGGGATTTINGALGPTFTFQSANPSLNIATSSNIVTFTVSTSTVQGLITGTSPINVTNGVVSLQGNLGSNNYYTSGYLNSSSTQVTNATTTGQFFLSALPNTILTTNGAGMVVATTTTFQPSGNYLTSVSVNSPLTGNGTSGSALGLSGNFGSLNVTTSGYLNASTTLATSATTTNLGILGVTGCNILNTTALGTVGCNNTSYLTSALTSLAGLTGPSITIATQTQGSIFTYSTSTNQITFTFPNNLLSTTTAAATYQTILTNPVTGTGTGGQAAYYTGNSGSTALTSSSDLLNNGTVVGVNATSSTVNLLVQGTGANSPFQVNSSSGTSLLTVGSNGHIGIGTSNPILGYFQSMATDTSLNGLIYNNYTSLVANPASNSTANFTDSFFDTETQAGNNSNIAGLVGESSRILINGSSTISSAVGSLSNINNAATSTVANAILFRGTYTNSGVGTTTNVYGLNIASPILTAGSIGNYWGVYVGTPTVATNNYAAYFGGLVGIGTTTPTSGLTIQGTSAAPNLGLLTIASSTGASLLSVASSGNIGIGTTTGGSLLQIQGTSSSPSILLFTISSSSGSSLLSVASNGSTTISSLNSGGVVQSNTSGQLYNSPVALTSQVSGVLSVANGGTGQSILTANDILFGNGTNGVASSSSIYVVSNILNASTALFTTLNVTGVPTFSGVSNCNGSQALQLTSGQFGCFTPTGGGAGGATTTINGALGPTFTFQSANPSLNIATSSNIVTFTVSTSTVQGLITGTSPINVTNGVVSLQGNLGSNNYYTSGYLNSSSTQVTNATTTGQFFLSALPNTILTTNGAGMVVATTTTFQPSGNYLTSVSVNSPLTGNGTSGSALGLSGNFGSLNVTTSGYLNASTTLATSATTTNLGILGVTGCNILNTTALGTVGCNNTSYLTSALTSLAGLTGPSITIATQTQGSIFTYSTSTNQITFTFPNNLLSTTTAAATYQTILTNPVTGTGTGGQAAYYTGNSGSTALTSSSDLLNNGTVVGVNATSSTVNLLVQGTGANSPFQVNSSSGTSLLTVLGNGNVGVGTSSPNQLLTVYGNLNVATGTTQTFVANPATQRVTLQNLTIAGITGSIQCLHVDTNGNITGTNSDCGSSGGGVLSGGTGGYVARWTATSTLSIGTLLDNGNVAGVNASSSTVSFNVQGSGTLNPFNVSSSTGTSLLTVLANGNVGIGTGSPVSQLANTSANTLDAAGTGINLTNGLTWAASGAGYVISAVNTSNASNANGLLVKTAGTSTTNRILTLNTNGTDTFVVQGNGSTTIASLSSGGVVQSTLTGQLYNSAVALGSEVSGILAVSNGGLGTSTLGNLSLGSGLTFTSGNGNQILVGTSTTIGLSSNVITNISTGTTGTIFNISTSTNSLTINLPIASSVNTGQLQSADWTTFNNKVGGSGTVGQSSYFTGAGTLSSASDLLNNGTVVGVNASSSTVSFNVQGTGTLNPFNVASSSGTSELFVGSNGNVGIGTTSPLANLYVQGAAGSANTLFTIASSSGTSFLSVASNGSTTLSSLAASGLVRTNSSGQLSVDNSSYLTSVNLNTNVSGVLPVANGGTGQSILTANDILFGNGTNGVASSSSIYVVSNILNSSSTVLTNATTTGQFFLSALPNTILTTNGAGMVVATTTTFQPSGNYLTSVSVNSPLTGNGTSGSALGLSGNFGSLNVTTSGYLNASTTLATSATTTNLGILGVTGCNILNTTALGTVGCNTSSYLTANQTITLSGAFTGSGATSIFTSFASTTPIAFGGTGITTAPTANGQLLMASSTGWTIGSLIAGTNVTITTTTPGQITIAAISSGGGATTTINGALGPTFTFQSANPSLNIATSSNIVTFTVSTSTVQGLITGTSPINVTNGVVSLQGNLGSNNYYTSGYLNASSTQVTNATTTGQFFLSALPNTILTTNGAGMVVATTTTFQPSGNYLTSVSVNSPLTGNGTSGSALGLSGNFGSLNVTTSGYLNASTTLATSATTTNLGILGVTGCNILNTTALGTVGCNNTSYLTSALTSLAGLTGPSITIATQTQGSIFTYSTSTNQITFTFPNNLLSTTTAAATYQTILTNPVTGTGTIGYDSRFTAASVLGSGVVIDNGTVAGINASSSTVSFNVQGTGTLNPFNVASSSGTSELFVGSNGNVGIGTTSPLANLYVQGAAGSANTLFTIASSSGTSFLSVASNGSTTLSSLAASGLVRTNSSGQLSVDNSSYLTSVNLNTNVSGVLPVANGGTGQSILTANDILFGNGTNGVASSSSIYVVSNILNSSSTVLTNATTTGQFFLSALPNTILTTNGAGMVVATTTTFQPSGNYLTSVSVNSPLTGNGTSGSALGLSGNFGSLNVTTSGYLNASTTLATSATTTNLGILGVTGCNILNTTALGTVGCNTSSYLTANQTITLSGAFTGSGATSIFTSFASTTPIAFGGTGITTAPTANGQLLMASSTGWTIGSLIAGTNVTITTTTPGQITIAAISSGGGATTTINGALGPTFTFQSANPSLNIATSSNIVTFTVSTSTVQGLITGTSPINVTNGVVSLQGNLGSNNYYTSGYLNASSTQVTNATTTGQFFLSALPNTILTTNGAGMVVATTTTFQPSGNYLTSVSVNSPLTGNGTSGSALGLSGNFGSLNVTTSGYLNASTTLATSATTTNLGILGVTGCNILNTTALGTVGCNTSSYLTANQTITLSGAFTGSGATSIFTSFASTTPIAFGGTGITTAPTANGQLLMASSTGWTIGSLIAGTNVTITTTTPGQITIAAISSGGGATTTINGALGPTFTFQSANPSLNIATSSNIVTFTVSTSTVQGLITGTSPINVTNGVVSLQGNLGSNNYYTSGYLNASSTQVTNATTTGQFFLSALPNTILTTNGAGMVVATTTTFQPSGNYLTSVSVNSPLTGNGTSGSALGLSGNFGSLNVTTSGYLNASTTLATSATTTNLGILGVTGCNILNTTALGTVGCNNTSYLTSALTSLAGLTGPSITIATQTQGSIFTYSTSTNQITFTFPNNLLSTTTAAATYQTILTNPVTGTGTIGYDSRFTAASVLGSGVVIDNGTVAGINASSSTVSFNVQGTGTLNPFNVASSSGTSELFVGSNGNVGIGTTSPLANLYVQGAAGSANTLFTIASSSGTSFLSVASNGSTTLSSLAASGLVRTNSSGQLSVDNSSYLTSVNLNTNVSGVLPVANGGTGQSILTANDILFGNGTNGVASSSSIYVVSNILNSSSTVLTNATTTGQFFLSALPNTILTTNGAGMVVATTTTFQPSGNYLTSVSVNSPLTGNGTSGSALGLSGNFGSLNVTTSGYLNASTTLATSATTTNLGILGVTGCNILNTTALGTVGCNTSSYLTANQTITLSGAFTGSGATSIFTSFASTTPIAFGGTGITTAPTANGQLLMASSTGWTIGSLIAGTNVTITTSTPGQITIAASGSVGLSSIAGLTGPAIAIATGTAGNIFNIATSSNIITFNIPFASGSNTGQLQSADWTTFNNKVGGSGTAGQDAYFTGAGTLSSAVSLLNNGTVVGVNATSSTVSFNVQGSGTLNPFNVASSSTGASFLTVLANGNVGIGTASPSSLLTVAGIAQINGNLLLNSSLIFSNNATNTIQTANTVGTGSQSLFITTGNTTGSNNAGNITIKPASDGAAPAQVFISAGTGFSTTGNVILQASGGNVGIGTSSPTSTLYVQATSGTNPFTIVSSTGSALLTVAPNGSTTLSSLGTGIVRSSSGSLYNDTINLGSADVSGVLAAANGGTGTTTLGSLTAGSGLSITGGQNVLIGTSTQISLASNVVTNVSTGTTGNIFNISTSTNSLTINLPIASSVNTGQLQSADWTTFNNKVGGSGTVGQSSYFTGAGTLSSASDLLNNGTVVGVNASSSTVSFNVQGTGTLNPFNVASSSGTSELFVGSNGNVGIGTTSPLANLYVQGAAGSANTLFTIASSSGTSFLSVASNGSTTLSSLAASGLVRTNSSGQLSVDNSSYLTSVNLNTNVSGVLPVANGGTGQSILTANDILFGNGTNGVASSSSIYVVSNILNSSSTVLTNATTTGQFFLSALPNTILTTNGAGMVVATTTTFQPSGNYLTSVSVNSPLTGNGTSGSALGLSGNFGSLNVTTSGYLNASTTLATSATTTNLGILGVTGCNILNTTALGTVGCNTSSYLTANQTITLSGAFTGSGATSIFTSFASTTPIAFGGTGITTAPTANGQLLMASSTGWTIGSLIAGTNVTITTTTPGQITIAAISSGGGATTTINGALGPTFTFQSANPSLNIATSSNIVTFTVSTSTVQGLITGTSPINVTNGVVSLQGNLGSNNYYTSGYLNSSSTQVTNATTTGQFFLSALPNTILTTNGAGMVVATTTTFQPSGNYLTSVSVNSPLTGNGTSGSALGLSGNFGSLNVTTSGYLNASTTLATSATTTNLGILGVTGCNILNTTALGTVGCNNTSYLTSALTSLAGLTGPSITIATQTQGSIFTYSTSTNQITFTFPNNLLSTTTAAATYQTILTNPVTGTGTGGQAAYYTGNSGSTALTSSSDLLNNGTVVGVNATSSTVNLLVQGTGANSPFQVNSSSGTSLLTVLGNGNVGVGTNAPGQKLEVYGGIDTKISVSAGVPVLVQHTFARKTSPGALAFGSNTGAGNFIAVVISDDNGYGSVSSITDTGGNAYTLATSSPGLIEIWYAKNITGGADTVTVNTTSGGAFWESINEFSGVDTVNPLDQVSIGLSTTSSGFKTTQYKNELIIGGGRGESGSAGSGYTLLDQGVFNQWFATEYETVGPIGSYDASFSGSAPAIAMATFRPPQTSFGTGFYTAATTGNIGITTSTPSQSLVIQGTAGQDILDIASSTGGSLLRVTQGGYVGIGTTTPTSNLYVQGAAGSANTLFTIASSSGTSFLSVASNGSTTLSSLAASGLVRTNSSGQLSVDNSSYLTSVNLNTNVSGVLPVANGGTGQSILTANDILFGNGTNGVASSSSIYVVSNILNASTALFTTLNVTGVPTFSGVSNCNGSQALQLTSGQFGCFTPTGGGAGGATTTINGALGPTFTFQSANPSLNIATSSNIVTFTVSTSTVQGLITGTSPINVTNGVVSLQGNLGSNNYYTSGYLNSSSTQVTNATTTGQFFLSALPNTILTTNGAGMVVATTTTFQPSGNYLTSVSVNSPLTGNGTSGSALGLSGNFGSLNVTTSGYLNASTTLATSATTTNLGILGVTGCNILNTTALGTVGCNNTSYLSGSGNSGQLAYYNAANILTSNSLFLDNGTVIGVNASSSNYTMNIQASAGVNPFNVASSSGASFLSVASNGSTTLSSLAASGLVRTNSSGQLSVDNSSYLTSVNLSSNVNGVLPVANGGTGTSTAPTIQGQLLANDGTGNYTPTNLVAGSNITITTSTPGQITITASGAGGLSGGIAGYNALWTSPNTLGTGIVLNSSSVAGINATSSTVSFNIQGSGNLNIFNVASSSAVSDLVVLSNGNVGLGSSTPTAELVVEGGTSDSSSAALNVTNSSNSSLFYVRDDGHIGIGTSNPILGYFQSMATDTSLNGLIYNNYTSLVANPASNSTANFTDSFFDTETQAGNNSNIAGLVGESSRILINGSGTISSAVGSLSNINNAATSTVANAILFRGTYTNSGVGTTTNVYGLNIASPILTAGSIGNYWGVYVGTPTVATNNYAAYFGGLVGIGTTTPTSGLTIQGTSAAPNLGLLTIASSTGASLLSVASSGNIGIGTTTGGSLLQIQGTSSSPSILLFTISSSSGSSLLSVASNGSTTISSLNSGGVVQSNTSGQLYNSPVALTSQVSGVLSVANGGTGQSILTANDILFGNGTNGVASSSSIYVVSNIFNSSSTIMTNATTTGQQFLKGPTAGKFLAVDANGMVISTTSPQIALTNPDTGTGTGGQVAYFTGNSGSTAITSAKSLLNNGTVAGVNATSSTVSFTIQASGTLNPFNVASTSGWSYLNVLANGNVGIGSSVATSLLTVQGTSTSPNLTLFTVASSTNAALFTVLANGNVGIGTTTPGAKFAVNASCTNIATNNACTDYAEAYPAQNPVAEGDIVSVASQASTTNLVQDSQASYDSTMLGVVSTNPAEVIEGSSVEFMNGADYHLDPLNPAIALAGRVPVKITTSTAIYAGDFLTSSDVPGVAMKAQRSGEVIGQALENYDPSINTTSNPTILVFVHPGYQLINNTIVLSGDLGQLAGTGGASATSSDASYLIDQEGSGNILQLQSSDQDRFLVASSGAVSILAQTASTTQDVLSVTNSSANLFSITAAGHISVGQDTAGTATIKAGDNQAVVSFNVAYDSVPKVAVTVQGLPNFFYGVATKTPTGFTIQTSQPVTVDTNFDWIVLAQPATSTSQSTFNSQIVVVNQPASPGQIGGGNTSSGSAQGDAGSGGTGAGTAGDSGSGSSSSTPADSGQVLGSSTSGSDGSTSSNPPLTPTPVPDSGSSAPAPAPTDSAAAPSTGQ